MCNLSENYRLRECYLQRDEVPTQSVIRKSMGPLADVFFKSLCPKRKVLVGLEPLLKGGGNDWYVTPEDLLKGRAVLKPLKNKALTKLNHEGINLIGTKLFQKRQNDMKKDRETALSEADFQWRTSVASTCKQLQQDLHDLYSHVITTHMADDYKEFARLYRKSLNTIEKLFHESAIADIKQTRENALQMMQTNYAENLKHQATRLHYVYEKKLMEEKVKLRAEFEQKIETSRAYLSNMIHDINIDKHVTIHHFKQYLERQNLACIVYVALKEREMCLAEMEALKHEHQKKIKTLSDKIAINDYEIYISQLKERKLQEFIDLWHKKVASVLKNFQNYVTHCLIELPEHAEFFINMEKLMLLQINDVLENPSAKSIIVEEDEPFHTPVPQANPFYLVSDAGYKARVDQDLCPRHTGSRSAAQLLPAIVINRTCLYAGCDNFERFSNKIKAYIHGYEGKNDDGDDTIYEGLQRFKYTSSDQQLELKLESSLMQVLQEEIDYVKQLPFKCTYCKMALCYCACSPSSSASLVDRLDVSKQSIRLTPSQIKMHEQEPKWESYCDYVKPIRCTCGVINNLEDHLPAYMRKMKYGAPEIPEYEICPVSTLKELVKNARKEVAVPPPAALSLIKKEIGTQSDDLEYEPICICASNSETEVDRMLQKMLADQKVFDKTWVDKHRLVGEDVSPSFMGDDLSAFATARAKSLMDLLKSIPDLQIIFDEK